MPLPYGSSTRHVNASHSGDTDIMKFYCTQYGTTYGKKWSNFEPRMGKHTGTGYLSNFRPGVYYSQRLDQLDNPAMGKIISDNYASVTEKSFRPYVGPSGMEVLPNSCKQVGSGFIRQKPITTPTLSQVRGIHMDTRASSAPVDIRPRAKPHLHKIRSKDPVELEIGGYGPGFMSTETSQRFQGAQRYLGDVSKKSVGPKEGSGFTHAYNIEPVTFHPDYAYKGEVPAYYTDRPTGFSIMKTHYQPYDYPHGDDPLPRLANRSDRDTGFTSGTKALPVYVNRVMADAYDKAADIPAGRLDAIKKKDPAEYLNTQHPNNHSSVTGDIFKGKQRPDLSESDKLACTSIGTKEQTGFTENNDRFVQTADNPARFITHYSIKYMNPTSDGKDRDGHTWGGVQVPKADGFTKSTKVDSFGPDINSTQTLRNLEPYVARSTRARNVFFDDHSYDAKLHTSKMPMRREVTVL